MLEGVRFPERMSEESTGLFDGRGKRSPGRLTGLFSSCASAQMEFATRCEKNINSAYTCWYHYDVSRNVITSGKHELRDRQLDGCDHSDVSRTYLPKCGRLKIKRVLNNNAVISSNSQNGDVLLGSGIAFQKKAGQEVDPQRVEKTFLLKDKEAQNRFTELMIDVLMAHILVSEKIINYAKIKLGRPL